MDPQALKFHPDHCWVSEETGELTIGLTKYAADELGEILFAELPSVGDNLETGAAMGSVESAKAVADLIAPVNGAVTAVNEAVYDAPETISADPFGEGWLIKVKPTDSAALAELLTFEQYQAQAAK